MMGTITWQTLAAAAALVLVLGGCGQTSEDVADNRTTYGVPSIEADDGIAIAESLVDALNAALVDTDAQAAAALFADDGVFIDKLGIRREGPGGISAYVEQVGPGITRCERTGPVEAVDSDMYVFPVEFTYRGVDYARDVALTTENGLITLHEFQTGG